MGRENKEVVMLLQYERHPEYCFVCGIIGHSMRECVHDAGSQRGGGKEFSFSAWMRASSPIKSGPGRYRRESEENNSSASLIVRKRSEELAFVPQDPPVARILRDTGWAVSKTVDQHGGQMIGEDEGAAGLPPSVLRGAGAVSTCEEDLHATGVKEGTLHENPSCMGGESTREVGLYGSVPCMVFSSSRNSVHMPHATHSYVPTVATNSVGSTAVSCNGVFGDAEGSDGMQSVTKGATLVTEG
ncbi:hypothetical protein ACOSQ2_028364 [Xanthoceras sorbifolium]